MANLTTNYYQVTVEQVDACNRVINNTTHKVFYQVQSASDASVEYHVEFNTQHHVLQCNCKAGSEGNNCWHKRAALAAEQEYQTEIRVNRDADLAEAMASRSPEEVSEQAAIQRWVGQGVDLETATRVAYAPPAERGPKGSLGYNKGFSLLK